MLNKWIGYYENVISTDLCEEILRYPWSWKESTYSNDDGVNSNSQNRVVMDEVWMNDLNRPYPRVKDSVLEIMRLYALEHERFSCIHHTDFRVNRYGVGGFMSLHHDNIHHSHGQRYGYPQVTVLLFINDLEMFGFLLNFEYDFRYVICQVQHLFTQIKTPLSRFNAICCPKQLRCML